MRDSWIRTIFALSKSKNLSTSIFTENEVIFEARRKGWNLRNDVHDPPAHFRAWTWIVGPEVNRFIREL